MAANKKKKPVAKSKPKAKAKQIKTVKAKAAKPEAKMKAAPKKLAPKKVAPQKAASKSKATQKNTQKALQKSSQTKTIAKPASAKNKLNFSEIFTPLDDRILVDAIPVETQTAGGIFIPEMAQEKQSRGIVVAVGPGKRNKKSKLRPLDVQMGDQVLYTKYAGTTIEVLGKEVLILREEEVIAIFNNRS